VQLPDFTRCIWPRKGFHGIVAPTRFLGDIGVKNILATVSFCLLATVSMSVFAATEAYKCTAEDGKVSYLDKKPTEGCVTIEVVHINVGKGSSSTQGGHTGQGEKADGSGEAQFEKEVAERKQKAEEACDNQRKNLEKLRNNAHIMIKDENGEEKMLSAEEHQGKIDQIEKYLQDFCS